MLTRAQDYTMGRELRKVSAYWQHPTDENGELIPLHGRSFTQTLADWLEEKKQWDAGLRRYYTGDKWVPIEEKYAGMPFEERTGPMPVVSDYMPEWPEAEKTHIQLYETTTEGTPQTPPFPADQLEQLCEYAAEHATVFGYEKTTKEKWLQMLTDGLASHKEGNAIFL